MAEDVKNERIKLLIITEYQVIVGWLELPIPSSVVNPTMENLLFYALNCGNKFMALHDCIISSREEVEYQPEEVSYFNINLDIVHSCKILDND